MDKGVGYLAERASLINWSHPTFAITDYTTPGGKRLFWNLDIRFDKKAVTKKIREEARAERKKFFQNLKKEIRGERIESEEDDDNPWDE